LEIFECKKYIWEIFRKYHYLNHNISKTSQCFCGIIDKTIVSFISIINFSHPKVKNLKKVHRLVVLPDFQGLGIGKKMMDFVCKIYKKNYNIGITTSQPSLIFSLKNDKNWKCIFFGKMGSHTNEKLKKVDSSNRLTASFYFQNDII